MPIGNPPTGTATDLDQRPPDDRQGITDVRVCEKNHNPCTHGCLGSCWLQAVDGSRERTAAQQPAKPKDTCPDSGKPCTNQCGNVCLPGVKHDTAKPRPTLIIHSMARAVDAVVAVGEYGARKYADDNWIKVDNAERRYTDAMHRHDLAIGRGETHDPESGHLHAAHRAWNALAALDIILRKANDTPTKTPGAQP